MTWNPTPLGELLVERTERVGTPDANGLPLLGVSNSEGLHRSSKTRIADMSRYLLVNRDWFAYNPMRINVGSLGWADDDELVGVISPDYVVFSATERVLPRLVYLFLKSHRGLREINLQAAGSVRQRLYFWMLAQIAMPLPPLSEQRRIVAKVEELAAKVAEAKGIRDKCSVEAEAVLRSGMRQAFDRCGHCEVAALQSVCSSIVDCLHSNPVYSDEGIPTVRSPDVGWGILNFAGAMRTSEAEYQRRTRRAEPLPGDLILVREGGGTGKAGMVQEGDRCSLGQRVMMLRADREKVLPKFLLYQWLSPHIQEDQLAPMIKGSASPHLNIKFVRRFDLVLPPMPEQRRIVAYLDDLLAKVDSLRSLQSQSTAELDALLSSILDRAFKGEL